jgi:hypothetical protein
MHYFLLIYFNNKPIHISSRLAVHHEEDQLCINSNWYSHALCWLAAGRIGMEQTAIGIVVRCVDWLLAGSGWNKQQLV